MTGIVILVLEWTVKQMTLNEAIEICQARIDLDREMRDGNEDNYNDYEKFCEKHCLAMEKLIKECKNNLKTNSN